MKKLSKTTESHLVPDFIAILIGIISGVVLSSLLMAILIIAVIIFYGGYSSDTEKFISSDVASYFALSFYCIGEFAAGYAAGYKSKNSDLASPIWVGAITTLMVLKLWHSGDPLIQNLILILTAGPLSIIGGHYGLIHRQKKR